MNPTPTATTSRQVTIEIQKSIHDVPAEQWNRLVGPADFYQSHEWLAFVERDGTAGPTYLTASVQGRPVAALPLYDVRFEGSPPYRPERVDGLLGTTGPYLVAGARRGYHSSLLLGPELLEPNRPDRCPVTADAAVAALVQAALVEARERGRTGLTLFYLSTNDVERLGRVAPVIAGFDSAEALVEGVGDGLEGFVRRQSSKRRAKVRRERRRYAETGWRTGQTRLADCLAEAAGLVARVERHHGQPTPDVLLRRIFRRQAEAVDHRAVVFTCRDDRDALVACSVNYAWRGTLYSRAVGLDYERLPGSFAYVNLLLYEGIEYAATHGVDRLQLGLASALKLERGAIAAPLWTVVVPVDPRAGVGIRLVDGDAMRAWSEPYLCYESAFPAGTWYGPGGSA